MHWTLSEILDLDYFLHTDADMDAATLAKRDRSIFLELQQSPRLPSVPDTPEPRKKILLSWLSRRKTLALSPGTVTVFPGQMVAGALKTLTLYTSIFGLFIGVSMALTLLAYAGKAPINVFTYILVLIIPQILLVAGILLFLCFRRPARSRLHASPIFYLGGKAVTALAKRIASRFVHSLPAGNRHAFLATLGSISSSNQKYGRLFFWPLLSVTQCFGVMFNIGALGTTLVKVMGSDLAFGWQSTLQLSTRAVYHFVTAIALPWSWIIPGNLAHPSMEQISGSKMILKEGIYRLGTQDLVSWWPFLCFALICYGLLPRIILYILAYYASARTVKEHPLSSPDIDRLFFRMNTPVVETTPRDFPLPRKPQPLQSASQEIIDHAQPTGPVPESLVILIPEEISEHCPLDQLYDAIHSGTGVKPSNHVFLDPYDQDALLRQVDNMSWQENHARIAILQEAWQPPIREFLNFLTTLASGCGHPTQITIALIGKPDPESMLTPPDDLHTQVWKDQIARLANPAIEVIKIGAVHDH